MPNIRAANQIYTAQVQKISLLEGIVIEQEKQIQQITLAYNKCRDDWSTSDAITHTMSLQLKEKDGIIQKQGTMIRIVFGLATTAVGYTIYREIKK